MDLTALESQDQLVQKAPNNHIIRLIKEFSISFWWRFFRTSIAPVAPLQPSGDLVNDYKLMSKFVDIIYIIIAFNPTIGLEKYLSDTILLNKCNS